MDGPFDADVCQVLGAADAGEGPPFKASRDTFVAHADMATVGRKRALAGLADGLEGSNVPGPLVHSDSIWPRRLDMQDLCSNH